MTSCLYMFSTAAENYPTIPVAVFYSFHTLSQLSQTRLIAQRREQLKLSKMGVDTVS